MSEETNQRLDKIIKGIKPTAEYKEDLDLREDLKLDSLDVISFLFEIEEEFKIKVPEEDIDEHGLLNLGKLKEYIENKM